MAYERIELGWTVKDKITGFSGVAIARTEFLLGCAHVVLQPRKLNKDGEPISVRSFEELALTVVSKTKVVEPVTLTAGSKPGGPIPSGRM